MECPEHFYYTSPGFPTAVIHERLQFRIGQEPEFISTLALLFDLLSIPYVLVGAASKKIFGDARIIQSFQFLIEDDSMDDALHILRTAGFPQRAKSEADVDYEMPTHCPHALEPGEFFYVPVSGPVADGAYGTHRHICLYTRREYVPALPPIDIRELDSRYYVFSDDEFQLPRAYFRHSTACIEDSRICTCPGPFPLWEGGRYPKSLHPVKIMRPDVWEVLRQRR
ncbi:hypothetical protein BO94DRAFT_576656 [Aspergillus sclerotioniger CBS 115572]|uniref:Uncharacterized protein n=1 Tax=Aspergillus sclerotioniger CBS 115572 TaxID=1450535 RepID=A0A317W5W9_9EURO|nr:hypothetical protein BO94DRAFT_576656 [Aspergillus sclerotioniger CBS 115572]PWY81733.1 hypothetical protein BO94DRAFT_576656 [Aspergillus sclerotioniger CBS 115572]